MAMSQKIECFQPGTKDATLLSWTSLIAGYLLVVHPEAGIFLSCSSHGLIREYESEYHYLFHMVLEFSRSPYGKTEYFYFMPKALRKVLEIFLAFKLPGSEGLSSKVENVAKAGYGNRRRRECLPADNSINTGPSEIILNKSPRLCHREMDASPQSRWLLGSGEGTRTESRVPASSNWSLHWRR